VAVAGAGEGSQQGQAVMANSGHERQMVECDCQDRHGDTRGSREIGRSAKPHPPVVVPQLPRPPAGGPTRAV
jgi:hypothetical protein